MLGFLLSREVEVEAERDGVALSGREEVERGRSR